METNNRQKTLLITVLVLGGLYIADSFIRAPLTASWSERSKHLKQMKTDLDDGRMLVRRAPVIRDTWERMKTNTLPSENMSLAESEFVQKFYHLAAGSGLNVSGTHPQWKQAGDDYMTLECRAETTGTIDTLAKFLYSVGQQHSIHSPEAEHMAMKIEALEITSKDNDGQQLAISLTVSGLMLGTQPPP